MEAQQHGFGEAQLANREEIQQNTFDAPDHKLGKDQGNKVISEKKIQNKPKQGLRENIYADTGK